MSQRIFSPTVSSELYQSAVLIIPLILSNLVQSATGFLGTVMIAHLGRDDLAAVALGWAVYVVLMVFFFGLFGSVSVLVSQSFGAKDQEGVRLAVVQGFWMAFAVSVPGILLLHLGPWFLGWSGQDAHIISLAARYLHALSFCLLPLSCLVIMEQFLIGIAQTRLVLFISLLQIPFEIVSIYCFIFGKLGLPAYGVAGIGYGFALVCAVASIFIAAFISVSHYSREYRIFSHILQPNWRFFHELLRVGWPIGLMNVIEVALMSVIAFLMGHFGSNALAAHQITRQFWILGMMFVFSIAQVTTVRVGHAVGRNDKVAVKCAAYVNMGIGFISVFCVVLLGLIFSRQLVGLDISRQSIYYAPLMHYAVIFLSVALVSQLFDTLRFIAIGALRGIKDTRASMYISFIAFWLVGLPIAYLLGFVMHLGGLGLWLGVFAGIATGATIVVLRFKGMIDRVDITTLLTRAQES